MKTNDSRSSTLLLLPMLLFVGCAGTGKIYEGPQRKQEEIAVVRATGKHFPVLSISIQAVDATSTFRIGGTESVEVLPGPHVISLFYQWLAWEVVGPKTAECKVAFEAQAGQSYTAGVERGRYSGAFVGRHGWVELRDRCYVVNDASNERFEGSLMTPLTNHARQEENGYSFDPPQGKNWFVRPVGDDYVWFEKLWASDDHRTDIQINWKTRDQAFKTPEEYLKHVNERIFSGDPERHEYLVKGTRLEARYGPYCVRFDYKFRYYPKTRAEQTFHFVDGHGYACLHPAETRREFDVWFEDKHQSGEEDAQFRSEGEKFLEGFSFTKLKQ